MTVFPGFFLRVKKIAYLRTLENVKFQLLCLKSLNIAVKQSELFTLIRKCQFMNCCSKAIKFIVNFLQLQQKEDF